MIIIVVYFAINNVNIKRIFITDAVFGLRDLLAEYPHLIALNLSAIAQAVVPLILDDERNVRRSLVTWLTSLLPQMNKVHPRSRFWRWVFEINDLLSEFISTFHATIHGVYYIGYDSSWRSYTTRFVVRSQHSHSILPWSGSWTLQWGILFINNTTNNIRKQDPKLIFVLSRSSFNGS